MSNQVLKKWLILFLILLFPYLVVQYVENATHNILTLGYRTIQAESLSHLDTLQVPDFNLINQDGNAINKADLIGFNYVVNFFFTSCPTICPTTTLNLIEFQNKIREYGIKDFKIISISVDPNNDTPKKLKEYAVSMGIDLSNWELLTGKEEDVYGLVRDGFTLSVGRDSIAPGGIFHSPNITIIDKLGYIRTGLDKKKKTKYIYDGTLYSDIKLLVGEIQRLSIIDYKDDFKISKEIQ